MGSLEVEAGPGEAGEEAGGAEAQAAIPTARTVSSHELCREPDPINLHPVLKIDAMAELTPFSL
jgi:hypothetical protein